MECMAMGDGKVSKNLLYSLTRKTDYGSISMLHVAVVAERQTR